jgi:hypothetical protein
VPVTTTAPAMLPPETPASNPALAADPLPVAQSVTLGQASTAPAVLGTTPAPTPPATLGEPAAAAPAPAKRKAGRKTNAERAARASAANGQPAQTDSDDADGFELYINSLPLSGDFTYLDDYCNDLCDRLAKKEGVIDVRCAEAGILSHGKWQGVISALAKAVNPEPGVYVVFTDSNVKTEIAAALAPLARGGARSVR